MKKIPTLFEREYENHKVIGIIDKVHPGMEWVLHGEGVATEKIDGSCCAMIRGALYGNGSCKFYEDVFSKRFTAKSGREIPPYALPCCDPDPVTGNRPYWVPISPSKPVDKWYWEAFSNFVRNGDIEVATYEAIGPHFQGNPYKLEKDTLRKHGDKILKDVPRSFLGIKDYLSQHNIEGIVFWKDGEPQCKIKRSDFGFPWNKK